MTPTWTARDFLTLGFVPDAARAEAHYRSVVPPREGPPATGSFPELLTEAIHDGCFARGEREIALPLTGGFDSRGILGAALDVYAPASIHAFTFGTKASDDCSMAMRVCRRLGIRHTRVDPYAVNWDLDHAVTLAGEHWRVSGGLPPIDRLLLFDHLGRSIPPDLVVLSGYIGGVNGRNLPTGQADLMDPAVAVEMMLRFNRIVLDGWERDDLRELFTKYMERNPPPPWLPGATFFDPLEIGFRQALRIRPNVTACFRRVFLPYEDPRLVRYWLSRTVEERAGAALYKRILQERFGDLLLYRRRPSLRNYAAAALDRILPPRRLPSWADDVLQTRGDPRRHPGMLATLRALNRSFDGRGIMPQRSMTEATEAMLKVPVRFRRIRWPASAELYIRAGVLAPG